MVNNFEWNMSKKSYCTFSYLSVYLLAELRLTLGKHAHHNIYIFWLVPITCEEGRKQGTRTTTLELQPNVMEVHFRFI